MNFFHKILLTGLAALGLAGSVLAQSTSITLDGLPDYDSGGGVPAARINTLSVTLDPGTGAVRGPRGQTVGWGFKVTWDSNAGDKIAFTGSRLVGETSALTTGYQDYIGRLSGKTNGAVSAGQTWEVPFVNNRRGLGAVPIPANAKPGSGYVGQLKLSFDVYDSRGPDLGETLGTFFLFLDVSVTVASGPPVDQTISFAPITNPTYGNALFTVNVTADSGLPVTLTSLNTDVCTVDGNTVTIIGAGDCTLLAEQDGDTQYNPAPMVTQSFTVAKAPATVAITGALIQNYDGTPKSLSGASAPGSLDVTLLYGGDPTAPALPGLYFVKALINDPHYEGFAGAELFIVGAKAPVLTTYNQWLVSKFSPADLTNAAVVGGPADPDADGFQNSFEYAMGFDPLTPADADRAALPQLSVTDIDWTLFFSIPETAASDVTFVVETINDLSSGSWQVISRRVGRGAWTGTANVFSGTPQNSRVPILVTQPSLPVSERRFYRMRVIVQ